MRKIILLTIAVFACCAFAYSQESEDVIKEIIIEGVDSKVSKLQTQIGFDDNQAQRVRETELTFYLGVRKIKQCFLCNKKNRLLKLQKVRDDNLQEILSPGQYIRYEGGNLDDVKKYPPQLK